MPDKEIERDSWSNHCEFFVTSLGLAVGLGNVWRFPYVCYQNGGGTFLIPYLIILMFIGIPGLFLEQSAGQYARAGVNKVKKFDLCISSGLKTLYKKIICLSNCVSHVIDIWSNGSFVPRAWLLNSCDMLR